MIFDLTNKESFLDIKNNWIKQVDNYTDTNAMIVLVGNKADAERNVTNEEIN